jgi:hypothetical protein
MCLHIRHSQSPQISKTRQRTISQTPLVTGSQKAFPSSHRLRGVDSQATLQLQTQTHQAVNSLAKTTLSQKSPNVRNMKPNSCPISRKRGTLTNSSKSTLTTPMSVTLHSPPCFTIRTKNYSRPRQINLSTFPSLESCSARWRMPCTSILKVMDPMPKQLVRQWNFSIIFRIKSPIIHSITSTSRPSKQSSFNPCSCSTRYPAHPYKYLIMRGK